MAQSSTNARLFGTDGIRGLANVHPMTAEVALRIGMAVASHFGGHGRVVVGKDTRRSGYMFETALASGLCSVGADVMLVGPLPTPAIAHCTHSMRADAGVVISASHNPFADNGIKIFAGNGFKLPDEVEDQLEAIIRQEDTQNLKVSAEKIGKALRIDDASGRYVEHVKRSFPKEFALDGIKIVVDCAHGAAYKIGPSVFSELGASVVPVGVSPDGCNINDQVGALYPENLSKAVLEHGADLGIALDGDADRVVMCDARGEVFDGDLILALCARDLLARKKLKGQGVVATVMSNLGLERSLTEVGLKLRRTAVGDRYVVEAMRNEGYNLGGEQSGHVVCLDHGTTGDGLVAALQVLAAMVRQSSPLADLRGIMQRYPQVSKSFRVEEKLPLDGLSEVTALTRDIQAKLGDEGRVLVRYSGTEPKLRVMVEGRDEEQLSAWAEEIGQCACREITRRRA